MMLRSREAFLDFDLGFMVREASLTMTEGIRGGAEVSEDREEIDARTTRCASCEITSDIAQTHGFAEAVVPAILHFYTQEVYLLYVRHRLPFKFVLDLWGSLITSGFNNMPASTSETAVLAHLALWFQDRDSGICCPKPTPLDL